MFVQQEFESVFISFGSSPRSGIAKGMRVFRAGMNLKVSYSNFIDWETDT